MWRLLAEQGQGPVQLSLISLLLGAALVLAASAVSWYLVIGLQRALVVGAAR